MKNKPWILVIEDEPSLLDVIKEQLNFEGYGCIKASKAIEACLKLSNQQFELIILDLNLEKGTGEDVISHLRNKPGMDEHINHNTPILVISGDLDKYRMKKIKDSIRGALVKPFSMKALIDKVKDLIGNNASA